MNKKYSICLILDCAEVSKFRISSSGGNDNKSLFDFFSNASNGTAYNLATGTVSNKDVDRLANEIAVALNTAVNKKSKQFLVIYHDPSGSVHASLLSEYVSKITETN